jgi:hypothetical protein
VNCTENTQISGSLGTDVVWSGTAKLVDQDREATLIQGKANTLVNEYSDPSDTLKIFAISQV